MVEYRSSQQRRIIYLLLQLVGMLVTNYLIFDTWLPVQGSKGIWFYAGSLSVILGSLIVTPFFTSPANALSYLVAALVTVYSLGSGTDPYYLPLLYYFGFASCVCLVGMFLSKKNSIQPSNLSNTARMVADALGSPRVVFTLILVYVLFNVHYNSSRELFGVSVGGLFLVLLRPFEEADKLLYRILTQWRRSKSVNITGNLLAYQSPGIMLIRLNINKDLIPGQWVAAFDFEKKRRIAVVIGGARHDDGQLANCLEVEVEKKDIPLFDTVDEPSTVITLSEDVTKILRENYYVGQNYTRFVGIVDSGSSTSLLYCRVTDERTLEIGNLIETEIRKARVLYQVIEAFAEEDSIAQKNKYGYIKLRCKKIGKWNTSTIRFDESTWLPPLNTPVYAATPYTGDPERDDVGHMPGSSFPARISSIDQLVTHGTAILGILGVGKTRLSLELVERIIDAGIKVIIIDPTSEYSSELNHFYDAGAEEESVKVLKEKAAAFSSSVEDNAEEGGSRLGFQDALKEDMKSFLASEKLLKIYDPNAFAPTRQFGEIKSYNEGGKWKTTKPLIHMTPAEITRMVSELALDLLQDKLSKKARVCLVFEEAHSLIPEWNSVAAEGDKLASAGTARAILQGRKFGLGCILITQRTANVTKSILNQCNTVFAMRTYDETGKSFLSNYFGSEYADALSSLPDRQAIFFGKASSCANPIIIRLNDSDKFIERFRAAATL